MSSAVERATRAAGLVLALLMAGQAHAQLAADDPDWKENTPGTVPAYDVARLVEFEVTRGSDLRWGVDPSTITIGADGVVRYVVVARSASGATNALFEGIRCARQEYRTYARKAGNSAWTLVTDSNWQGLRDTASRHALRLAQAGACTDNAPTRSVNEIVRSLRQQNPEHRH